MIPIEEPFDPADYGRERRADGGDQNRPGRSAHVPARPACRPGLTRRDPAPRR